jgi:LysR family transcriptional regulator, transcriptional activator of the cysJI operon
MNSLDPLDTRLFRAFVAAAEAGNFTLAALKAGMTQSGISQHIAKLEKRLGSPLFERVNKRVLLTPSGKRLKEFIEAYSEQVEDFVNGLSHQHISPSGVVRYAMPGFCLKTPHFPKLLTMRKEFPRVDLHVELLANDQVLARLLAGEIDFGFVTVEEKNPAIRYSPFATEEYVLVSAAKDELNGIDSRIEELKFVNYPGFGALFDIWSRHFFPQRTSISHETLQQAGWINDLDGAITMVIHSVGCTVVPKHCVQDQLAARKLFAYEGKKKKGNPVGTIYLVTRTNFHAPRRVQTVIDGFWKMKSL